MKMMRLSLSSSNSDVVTDSESASAVSTKMSLSQHKQQKEQEQQEQEQQEQEEQQDHFSLQHLYGIGDCVPGLVMLSDSEDASSFSSCGTAEEYLPFGPLHLMDPYSHHTTNSQQQQRNNTTTNNNNRRGNVNMKTTTSPPPPPPPIKRVRFNEARIREYAITVGDHPTCKDGLPLSLDWAHSAEWVYDINEMEWIRGRQQHQHHHYQQDMDSPDPCDNDATTSNIVVEGPMTVFQYHGGSPTRSCHSRKLCGGTTKSSLSSTSRSCYNNNFPVRRRTTKLDYWQRREILQRVGNFTASDLAKIERQQNQDAVSEFLAEAAHALDHGQGDEDDDDDDDDSLEDELDYDDDIDAGDYESDDEHEHDSTTTTNRTGKGNQRRRRRRRHSIGKGSSAAAAAVSLGRGSFHEEEGIEVKHGSLYSTYLEIEGPDDWQMTVQVLED